MSLESRNKDRISALEARYRLLEELVPTLTDEELQEHLRKMEDIAEELVHLVGQEQGFW